MKKIFAFVLALSMLCAMTGCDKNEGGISNPDSSNNSESSTSSVEDSLSSPSAPDPSSEESTGSTSEPATGQAEFDFDEAVKNITLFGNKISLPCTIADFGEDFSLDEDVQRPIGDTGNMLSNLLYQGFKIGTVIIKDCREGERFDNKEIVEIDLGFGSYIYPYTEAEKLAFERMGNYTGKIEHNFAGLSFDSTEKEAETVLGKPASSFDWSDGYELTYEFDNGHIDIRFDYQNNKILRFTVSVW
ncbi:MAG: hypothetical protein J1F09_06295 [Oscillospiraceae bacterium]|nr:hypothetical protein [Oscillospiraceae bacterium]